MAQKPIVIIPSGSKAHISGPSSVLHKISTTLHKPITVGNSHVPTSVSVPRNKLPVVHKIISGH